MRIRVTPEELRSAAQQFWRMADLMARLHGDINRADSYLDVGSLEGNVRDRVERHLYNARRDANRFESEASEIARELERIAGRFEAADQQNLGGMSWVSTQMTTAQAGYLPAAIGGGSAMWAMGGIAGDGSGQYAVPFNRVYTGLDMEDLENVYSPFEDLVEAGQHLRYVDYQAIGRSINIDYAHNLKGGWVGRMDKIGHVAY